MLTIHQTFEQSLLGTEYSVLEQVNTFNELLYEYDLHGLCRRMRYSRHRAARRNTRAYEGRRCATDTSWFIVSFRRVLLGQSRFVAPAVENSLDSLCRAVRGSRNSVRHLVFDGLNRETPKLLHPHRQPAEPLRAGTPPANFSDMDGDLVDAATKPAQGGLNPAADILACVVVERACSI